MNARPRHAFIDWLKCAGMTLIVYGHVAGWAPLADVPPIHIKQLGVAFFLFTLGYSIVQDSRPSAEVVFKRLFEVYLFGLAVALAMSAVGLVVDGHWRRSNYLPLMGGINVLFDSFPTNPTSWYIGTYIHFVVIGAVFVRRIRLTRSLLALALGGEVLIRAALIPNAGGFVAYMTAPNWATVFLLGAYIGQRPSARGHSSGRLVAATGVAFAAAWIVYARSAPLGPGLPFMLPARGGSSSFVALSAAISTVYLVATWLMFAAARRLERSLVVELLARNTLLIFLGHMPLCYVLWPRMPVEVLGRPLRSAILMVLCLPGLAAASEAIHRAFDLHHFREWAFSRTLRLLKGTALVRAARLG